MKVKTVPGGTIYTGPFKSEEVPEDEEGCKKLAEMGNKKAEEQGLKVRYEVTDD